MKQSIWKVPGRSIVCNTFSSWVHEIVYCYFVLKFFRRELNDMLLNGHMHKFSRDLYENHLDSCNKKNRDSWKMLESPEQTSGIYAKE